MNKILLLEGMTAACSNINNQQREMTDPWRDKVMAVMSMSEITNSCIVNQLSLNVKNSSHFFMHPSKWALEVGSQCIFMSLLSQHPHCQCALAKLVDEQRRLQAKSVMGILSKLKDT